MAAAPHVSVITPFLNAEAFLRESVESVRAQTYDAWELLLIDDGSTDASTGMALEYARRYPDRIRYLEHPGHANHGTSAALNLGIRHARGALIALIDADDVWLSSKLEQQVPLLEAHPEAGMLYSNSLFWRSWNNDATGAAKDFVPPLGVPVDAVSAPPAILTQCLRRRAAVPCPSSVLMRREVVERVGGFEESFRVTFSDQAFYTKMFLAAPVYVANRVWDKYRLHEQSAVAIAKRSGTVRQERGLYLEYVADYLKRQRLATGPVWRAVQIERWLHRHPHMESALTRVRRAWRRTRAGVVSSMSEDRRRHVRRLVRPPGGVRFGNLRRVTPVSRHFGVDRGQPIDRHYIEAFLARHSSDVAGRVLEIGDDAYTRRFGGSRVTRRDVLHAQEGNPNATFVDDLAVGASLPSDAFDCAIVTQTLQYVFDLPAAMRTLHRILKPGGVLLATVPGISHNYAGRWTNSCYWAFTTASVHRLCAESFPAADVHVRSHGNVLSACAFLQGLAREEISPRQIDAHDAFYPVIVTVRARKGLGGSEDRTEVA